MDMVISELRKIEGQDIEERFLQNVTGRTGIGPLDGIIIFNLLSMNTVQDMLVLIAPGLLCPAAKPIPFLIRDLIQIHLVSHLFMLILNLREIYILEGTMQKRRLICVVNLYKRLIVLQHLLSHR